jgi:hypothetical protein
MFGKARSYNFDLIAQSQDHARYMVAVSGKLLARPMLPGWVPLLLLGILGFVALVVIVALVLILRTPPPQPQFSAFEVNKTTLARGEVLEINWQAVDVENYRVSVNGTPVAAETDMNQYNVPTDDLSGEVTVLVEGFSRDQSDSRSTTVTIYEPMHVERFTVNPPQLVRYAVQGLNIEWNVPGARTTRVTGIEEFTTVSVESGGPSGNFTDIPGIPRDPIVMTLIAEDEYGNVLESSLTINVISPECTPIGEPVTIYAGPDPAHQVVGTVPSGVQVIVDARDPSGDWVRVIGLTGGISGWVEVSEMVCANTFNVRDLQIEPNIPAPPPTPSPTLTLTPTPTITATVQSNITPTGTLAPPFTPSG